MGYPDSSCDTSKEVVSKYDSFGLIIFQNDRYLAEIENNNYVPIKFQV